MSQFEVKQNQNLFIIEQRHSRGFDELIKSLGNTNDIFLGRDLSNDDDRDEFLDSLDNWIWSMILSESLYSEQPKDLIQELSTKGYFSFEYDEGIVGIGLTKQLAIQGYMEVHLSNYDKIVDGWTNPI